VKFMGGDKCVSIEVEAAAMSQQHALVWEGGSVVTVRPVTVPEARHGWVAVDVAYAGICGFDLHIAAGEHGRAQPGIVLSKILPRSQAAAAIDSLRRGEGLKVLIEPGNAAVA